MGGLFHIYLEWNQHDGKLSPVSLFGDYHIGCLRDVGMWSIFIGRKVISNGMARVMEGCAHHSKGAASYHDEHHSMGQGLVGEDSEVFQ